MSGLQRWLNCKYLKIGSGAIVYYHGIHIEYFPSGNKYLFQKGNNVRLNCFQTVTHRDGECPYRSTLWRSYTHFSDNTMTVTSRPVSRPPRLTQFFFLLVMSHSQGWGRSLNWPGRWERALRWLSKQKEYACEQTKWVHFTHTLSLFFSISLISYLDHPPAESTEVFYHL